MRTLSDLALRSAHAESTDEVWLVLLEIDHAEITDGPLRFVNDMQDLRRAPANLLGETDITLWTPTGTTGGAEALGSEYRVNDTGTDTYRLSEVKSGLTGASSYTAVVRIKKDDVPRSTRHAAVRFVGGANSTVLSVDTSTGETDVTHSGTAATDYGVLDDGDYWLVYLTRTGNTAYTLEIRPAAGTNFVTQSNVTGSTIFNRPTLYEGAIGDLTQYVAFPFQLEIPGEDPDQPSGAKLRIDNVDRQIVEAIRGLTGPPTCNFEVVLASQPETVEIGFYDLTIRAADYDSLVVEATMTYEQIFTEPLTLEMTPARFPGLF